MTEPSLDPCFCFPVRCPYVSLIFKETNELSLNENWKTRTIAEPSIRIDDTDTDTSRDTAIDTNTFAAAAAINEKKKPKNSL